jgi:hypothetical protein
VIGTKIYGMIDSAYKMIIYDTAKEGSAAIGSSAAVPAEYVEDKKYWATGVVIQGTVSLGRSVLAAFVVGASFSSVSYLLGFRLAFTLPWWQARQAKLKYHICSQCLLPPHPTHCAPYVSATTLLKVGSTKHRGGPDGF